jgi:hypothetical protein
MENRMLARQKLVYLAINVVGGLAVLGSYAYGFIQDPDLVQQLWGDVPQALLGLYNINMLLASTGYLLMLSYILTCLPADCRSDSGGLVFERLNYLTGLILFCSALWMPLSFALLDTPNLDLWWCIRAVLFGTGASALVCAYQVHKYAEKRGLFLKIALCAYFFFCVQTALLDALIWPYYFPI